MNRPGSFFLAAALASLFATAPARAQDKLEIFSWWGIIVAHLIINLIPLKVFLLTPAFRNINSSLEEASRTSGASGPSPSPSHQASSMAK